MGAGTICLRCGVVAVMHCSAFKLGAVAESTEQCQSVLETTTVQLRDAGLPMA